MKKKSFLTIISQGNVTFNTFFNESQDFGDFPDTEMFFSGTFCHFYRDAHRPGLRLTTWNVGM